MQDSKKSGRRRVAAEGIPKSSAKKKAHSPGKVSGELVRYIRPADIDGVIVSGTAFERKLKDKDGVSVTRLGMFSKALEKDLNSIRTVMNSRLKMAATGKLGQISSVAIANVGSKTRTALEVMTSPSSGTAFNADKDIGRELGKNKKFANPAHAVIVGLPFNEGELDDLEADLAGDLLARAISTLHPIQIPSSATAKK